MQQETHNEDPVVPPTFYRRSASIAKLAAALASAQGEIKSAVKDSANPHYKSKYAGLDSLVEVIRQPLSSHGLAYTCPPMCNQHGAGVGLILTLKDSDEWIEYPPLLIPVGKWDAHGIGSAQTYSLRYMLRSVFVVPQSDEDDDGNAAAKAMEEGKKEAIFLLQNAAKKGTDALKSAWESLRADQRGACAKEIQLLKTQAKEIDDASSGK